MVDIIYAAGWPIWPLIFASIIAVAIILVATVGIATTAIGTVL